MKMMGEEMADLRFKEEIMREKQQIVNNRLRDQLQEKYEQLATMTSLDMEALQWRHPSKTYAMFLKEKWFQFKIKTLAQYG